MSEAPSTPFPNWTVHKKGTQTGGRDKFRKYQDKLVVIVSFNGSIILTSKSLLALGNPKHVKLVYDGPAGLAGVDPSTADEGGYSVTYNAKLTSGSIGAAVFTKRFNLVSEDRKYHVFPAGMVERTLTFSLRDVPEVV
jgi:hypothetical protein